jgi:alpha-galactosidase
LPEKAYRGELYDIGFDRPEAHVVEDRGTLYYAFYAEHWRGPVELRGLDGARYAVTDYYHGRTLGEVTRAAPRLDVEFEDFLLLQATPIKGARA